MDLMALIPFVAYFILVILIGVFSSGFSSKGISEFFIGGRKMNLFVVALSAVVSGRSAWLLLGFTGQSYTMGLSAIWAVVGYIIVEFFLFLYYAPRLRKFAEKHNCITIPDFFAARFKDKSGSLRILIATIFLIFMITYVGAQFVGGGKAFLAYFDLRHSTGLVITASIVLIYTILGGFLAVSYTDVLQAIVMIVALIGLPVYGIIQKGGMGEISSQLSSIESSFFNPVAFGFGSLIGLLGIGLGSPGNPHILIRYMSIKNYKQLKWTAIIGTAWNILLAGGAFMIGIVARAYFPELQMLPDQDPENAYISLANELLPTALVGILLASIFAAIMSTADSQLLVAASSVVRDIYQKVLNKDRYMDQERLAMLSRFVVAVLVYLAVMMAFIVEDIVFWFVLFAWAGLGAAIGPASIQALYRKRTTKAGVMAGMIAGTLTVFIWKTSAVLSERIYELIPGFIAGWIFTYWGSELEHFLKRKGKTKKNKNRKKQESG
ncbi:MAG: sodium/proline symporter [Bacteroidota bacterium]